MEKDEVKELLTGFQKKKTVRLPMAKTSVTLRVPTAAEMLRVQEAAQEMQESDLAMAGYILRHFCIEPNLKEFTDQEVEDMVQSMHIVDLTRIILSLLDMREAGVPKELVDEAFQMRDQR